MLVMRRFALFAFMLALLASALSPIAAQQEQAPAPPQVGQKGKDVQWVPTPPALVEKMLDMAAVTPKDYLVDLGSGDGITVIAAAKRGVRALGIEYDGNLVELSKRNAKAAGVDSLARFTRGDIFKTDFSRATVVTTFLLPSLNLQLRPTILAMKPGTRVVSNSFPFGDWEPDDTATIDEPCERWCKALFWVVPARIAGIMADAERRSHADPEIPVRVRDARQRADLRRPAARRPADVHGRHHDLLGTCQRLPNGWHVRDRRAVIQLERDQASNQRPMTNGQRPMTTSRALRSKAVTPWWSH